jgi:hypothetical protein
MLDNTQPSYERPRKFLTWMNDMPALAFVLALAMCLVFSFTNIPVLMRKELWEDFRLRLFFTIPSAEAIARGFGCMTRFYKGCIRWREFCFHGIWGFGQTNLLPAPNQVDT